MSEGYDFLSLLDPAPPKPSKCSSTQTPDELLRRLQDAFVTKHTKALAQVQQQADQQDARLSELAQQLPAGPPAEWLAQRAASTPAAPAEPAPAAEVDDDDGEEAEAQRLQHLLAQPKWRM